MVQGWESRAHLANKRREEARERKQSKKGPQKLNGEVIINQILKNNLIDLENHAIEAWVENELGGKAMCYSHFRAEACLKHKRCKFSHEFTISLNRGHQYSASEDNSSSSETHMDCYSNLKSIPINVHKNLSLLFLDRVCIYDSGSPTVWHQWYERINNQKCSRESEEDALRPITEVDSVIGDDESVQSLEEDDVCGTETDVSLDTLSVTVTRSPPPHHCHMTTCLPPPLLLTVLSFVSDVDLCNLCASSLTMKNRVLSLEEVAYRRRVLLLSVTLTGKDLSKLRKLEKKKKQKQANLKSDSKKGHKAVKVCRR